MRRALLLTLALLAPEAWLHAAVAQEKVPAKDSAKAPENPPAKAPEKAPVKAPEKASEKGPEKPPTPDSPAATPQFTADLIDGIRLIGEPVDLAALPLKTQFAKLDIPLPLIASAAFNKDRTLLQVRFKNGDLISGTLELERIRLRTAYGEANLPIAKLAMIAVK